MNLFALMLLVAAPADGAVEAERAFARDAQIEGQWTAFRSYAADDAVMFTPGAANAHEVLEGRDDPISAVMWWPARSYVSCDGQLAVNTGSWIRSRQRSLGYVTTVWQRQADGSWKWILDHGDQLENPRPVGDEPEIRQAVCPTTMLASQPSVLASEDGDAGVFASPDQSLRVQWRVEPNGSRHVSVELHNGEEFERVIDDRIVRDTD